MALISPEKGVLLISEPFLPDPNFHRSVVMLTEHDEQGSVGLVLNHPGNLGIRELFEDLDTDAPVFVGGPVSRNSMLFMHEHGELAGAEQVLPGLYWGGDFEMLKLLVNAGLLHGKIKFFAGYSGWGPGQLQGELEQKSWIVAPGLPKDVFTESGQLWKNVLTQLGPEFRHLGNAPEDVQLN
ncbi:MAG: YqgE/AlgH family protein [Sphingomonadales bacterium]